MEILQSGLSEIIADSEDLARFLMSSSQYNSIGVKPSAFLPNPNDDYTTSVYRQSGKPESELWELGVEQMDSARTLYGAAIVTAELVRNEKLVVVAKEPPPKHADICNWPLDQFDPDLQKARHKEIALAIASHARLLLRQ